jgi:hypothetical protein
MQTLFTNDDRAGAVEQARWRLVICAAFGALSAAFLATSRWHDIPLALLVLLTALGQTLGVLKPALGRSLRLLAVGSYAAVGVIEIRRGRGFGWALFAWAMVIAASFIFGKRRRQPDGARA